MCLMTLAISKQFGDWLFIANKGNVLDDLGHFKETGDWLSGSFKSSR